MLFKDGIQPMWEDAANARGGKWVLRMKKGVASQLWEETLLAMIGEQFDVGNEVCGAVMSVRYHEDNLSVWNRTAENDAATAKIRCVGGAAEGGAAGGGKTARCRRCEWSWGTGEKEGGGAWWCGPPHPFRAPPSTPACSYLLIVPSLPQRHARPGLRAAIVAAA
jgi:hypothetical protein